MMQLVKREKKVASVRIEVTREDLMLSEFELKR